MGLFWETLLNQPKIKPDVIPRKKLQAGWTFRDNNKTDKNKPNIS
ncbi:hypothetical protein RintRC_6933 [Richelia intracellularis]|nr:hypothetical protein RintRC_6933 [Richelia intracellularis]